MKFWTVVGVAVLALCGAAQAREGQWNVQRARVGPDRAATLHTHPLAAQARVQSWVRVNGANARAVVAGSHLILYRAPGVDILERTGRTLRWRIANHTTAPVRVTVGWQRFR